jgi:hypothetical protein
MPEWWSVFIGPAGPVIGAIVGAGITAAVAFRNRERRRVTFVIYPTDDLTSPLREHHKFISFKIGEREMWRLNRSRVRVGNTGNVAIRDLQFKVVCLGDHANYFAEPGTTDFDVRNSVKIEWAEGEGAEYDPYFYCLSPVPKSQGIV